MIHYGSWWLRPTTKGTEGREKSGRRPSTSRFETTTTIPRYFEALPRIWRPHLIHRSVGTVTDPWMKREQKILMARFNLFSPSFSNQVIEIDEAWPIGREVFKVSASDEDQGENGYISYSIANLHSTPFAIDHFTGQVRKECGVTLWVVGPPQANKLRGEGHPQGINIGKRKTVEVTVF
jgi:hypothetical protein